MGIIFALSNQSNSSEMTKNVIQEIIPIINTNNLINRINFLVRKSAHIIEYFILTLLTVSLLKKYTKTNTLIILISLIFCFLYACTDEYHQSFIIGRSASFKDVLVDTSGIILFLITYIIYNLKYKQKNSKTLKS